MCNSIQTIFAYSWFGQFCDVMQMNKTFLNFVNYETSMSKNKTELRINDVKSKNRECNWFQEQDPSKTKILLVYFSVAAAGSSSSLVTTKVIRLISLKGLQKISHYKIREVITGPEQMLINGVASVTRTCFQFWLLDQEGIEAMGDK